MLAVVRGRPGVPAGQEFKVHQGPFCAGDWQFTSVRLASDPNSELLSVITRGVPPQLQLVEAGTDVCSSPVETTAPTGIRSLACGF